MSTKVEVTKNRNVTRQLIILVLSLGAAYGFASLAIDRGNVLWYLMTFVLVYVAARALMKLIRR